jgi:hypothetical protein
VHRRDLAMLSGPDPIGFNAPAVSDGILRMTSQTTSAAIGRLASVPAAAVAQGIDRSAQPGAAAPARGCRVSRRPEPGRARRPGVSFRPARRGERRAAGQAAARAWR